MFLVKGLTPNRKHSMSVFAQVSRCGSNSIVYICCIQVKPV